MNDNTDSKYTQEELLSKSTDERLAMFESICIGYPLFNKVFDEMQYCHMRSKTKVDPECMMIVGGTGAGKSALLRKYCEKYPREMLEKTTKVTVLSALIPESSDQKNLVTEILFSLGDPCYSKGSKAIQTTRLRLFLKDCQTEIIILDEFQHCIDRDNNKVLKAVSDWLKLLIENTRIPIVLMGQPESLRILDDNPQLSRRFGQREYLRPFQFNNAEEIEGFRTFLYAFDISLPLCERSNLSSTGTASRLYYASNGVVGYVHKIIEKAFEKGLSLGQEHLDMDMLAEAFETYVRKDLRKKINPFDIKEMDYIEASRLVIEEQSKKYTKRSGQKGVSNRINKKSR